jgi:hypothetical protein
MSEADVGKLEGWVEVIVRDKNGKIKYHIKPAFIEKCEDGEHCNTLSILSPSFPSELVEYYWRKNVITNAGLAAIVRLVFSGLTENKFGYIAIGTGTTAEAVTDTALQNEIKRKSATVTQTTTSVTGDTALLEATFSSADGLSGSSNVSEAGVFNASSGGTLLARKVFSAVPLNWDAGDSITIRYYIQMSR